MKKSLLIAILVIMALVLSISTASAAVTVSNTIDKDHPLIGSETQDASNPESDDENDE